LLGILDVEQAFSIPLKVCITFHGCCRFELGPFFQQLLPRRTYLFVKLSPTRVYDQLRARNLFRPILNKSIYIIVLHHVCEEVFLAPSGEHTAGNNDIIQASGSADDRCLMTGLGKTSHLFYRHIPSQHRFARRKFHADFCTIRHGNIGGDEFQFGPTILYILTIGDHGDTIFP